MTHFLLIAIGIAVVAATLPVAIELALLTAAFFLPNRRPRATSSPAAGAALAVVVPAHNEEILIARAIDSLQASAGRQAHVVVVAHNCSDQTASRAREAGAEVLVYDDSAARGKGFALRKGFEHVFSQGADAALVIDADSVVSANLIPSVRQAFERGASAVQCRYEMASAGERVRTRLAALALRGFNYIRPRGRSRIGLSSGILGNGFAISKQAFLSTPYRALSVVEDLEYHIHLVLAGQRVEFLEDASVLAHFPVSKAGEASQRSRWEGGRLGAARRWLLPLGKQVLSGRLRLLEPLIDLANLPLAFAVCLLLFALALPMAWLRIYCAAALTVVILHVITAAWAGEDFLEELLLLFASPAYILWKLRLLPSLIRGSGATAAWVRTERAAATRKI